jgi:hypothetical protein
VFSFSFVECVTCWFGIKIGFPFGVKPCFLFSAIMSHPTARQKSLAIKAMAACGGVRSVVGTVISPSALDSMDDAMDVDDEVVPIPDLGLSHAAVSVMLFFLLSMECHIL